MTGSDAKRLRPPSAAKLWDHLGVVLTLLAGGLIIVRLLAVSGWDQQTAKAVLQHGGSSNLIIGALLSAFPAVLGTTLAFLGGRVPYRLFRIRRKPRLWDLWQMVMVALVLFATSGVYYLILFVAAIPLGIIFGINDRTMPTTGMNSNKRFFVALVISPAIVSLIFSDIPWMPREIVSYSDGTKPTVGYVLKDDGERITLLVADPRAVLNVRSQIVKSRELCGSRSVLNTPLIALVSTRDPYKECPD